MAKEKFLAALSSLWAKAGVFIALLGGAFAFGSYYKETVMIREQIKSDEAWIEKLETLRNQNFELRDINAELTSQIKELQLQIKYGTEK